MYSRPTHLMFQDLGARKQEKVLLSVCLELQRLEWSILQPQHSCRIISLVLCHECEV